MKSVFALGCLVSGALAQFELFGVNESGAEYGSLPGTPYYDYTFASQSTLETLMGEGYNVFRLPFLMERMVPNEMTGPINTDFLSDYSVAVDYITSNGGYAILDPHNYGRYYGNIINDTAGFQAFWTTVASQFVDNAYVIFDTNNEYHDMEQSLVYDLNQAAIDGIRSTGATSQYIFVEGNSYTGAWTWNTTNTDLVTLEDPENLIVFEMHQYLDSDGSGTSSTCVSSDVGVQRIEGATAWLQQNNKIGFLGEYAGGNNTVCEEAIVGMLNSMLDAGGVWLGATWWAGGPWWGDYMFSYEPPSGTAYTYYDSVLVTYAP